MNIIHFIDKKVITVFLVSMLAIFSVSSFLTHVKKDELRYALAMVQKEDEIVKLDLTDEVLKDQNVTKRVIVYKGMTMNELADKLNRSMKSTIAGKGELLASYSLEKGVDPYVALSIMLLETGCNSGTCSSLTRKCYNVGGMKGSPGCDGGSYKTFASIDDGIMKFIDNLSGYYARGLDTPEKMNSRYAESSTWAMKVRNYMSQIERR